MFNDIFEDIYSELSEDEIIDIIIEENRIAYRAQWFRYLEYWTDD